MATIRTDAKGAERLLRLRVELMRGSVRNNLTRLLREGKATAQQMSSGPYSQAQLTRMGHPYARRRPRPPLAAYIINIQSGRFRAGWRVQGPREESGNLVGRIMNAVPYGAFLDAGTRLMIARPIVQAITKHLQGYALAVMRRTVKDALIEGR